ncbi:WLM domain containing protein [Naviculisporaceae sp. PSN 640]
MDPSTPPKEEPEPFKITIIFSAEHFSEPWTFSHPPLLDELVTECEQTWPQYDWEKTKAIPTGRNKPPGFKALLKTPEDESLDLAPLNNLSLKLMAPKISDITSLQAASSEAATRRLTRAERHRQARLRAERIAASSPRKPRIAGFGASQGDAQYTFHSIRPLPHLPNPERSLAFLERLRDDPGIRSAMKKHQFSVGLLTEMDPGEYTESTHEGTTRILGLNQNKGQAILLRLRTDAYDGYRDYKTIRKTLCHELAHNVHSDHDRKFWDLTHQIEREVHAADYKKGGRTVGGEEYAPEREGGDYGEEDEVVDHGGWVGGTFVLGGGGSGSASGNGNGNEGGQEAGLSMREMMARAAEQRYKSLEQKLRKLKTPGGKEEKKDGEGGSRPAA